MIRTFLKSKIHRATVTHSDLDYEGSCAIDSALLKAANILPYEQIDIYNISNGERFTTYAIEAPENSGIIGVNGAAAWKAKPYHLVIIVTYAQYNLHYPGNTVVFVDGKNKITSIKSGK